MPEMYQCEKDYLERERKRLKNNAYLLLYLCFELASSPDAQDIINELKQRVAEKNDKTVF